MFQRPMAVAMDQTFRGRTGDVEELGAQLARFALTGLLKDSYPD